MHYGIPTTERYFHRVRRYILSTGERFATVVDESGAPAYYPTAMALAQRHRGVSVNTMEATAADLVHIGLWALRERIDLNRRLETGAYLDPVEVETLAEACGVTTPALRRTTSKSVTEIRRGVSFSTADLVTNQQKHRRLTSALNYFDYVGRMSEAHLPKRSIALSDRVEARDEMLALIKSYRPKTQSSRVRGIVKAGELARVAAFVATGDPFEIWSREDLARRNWALVTLLIACGLRQGEERQLKPSDVDLAACELRVERRHDDPEDPRFDEGNAKTFDRIIPFGAAVAQVLEDYLLGPGSDAAERRGSAFIFLSHDNRTYGSPISSKTPQRVVRDLGLHLGIDGLTPHHLRHGWIQNLADWAVSTGLDAAEFERFANNLGGWSYVSRMAAAYRGDHLTEAAFKAGLDVQGARA